MMSFRLVRVDCNFQPKSAVIAAEFMQKYQLLNEVIELMIEEDKIAADKYVRLSYYIAWFNQLDT
jgi:hypothetical protein